MLTCHGCMRHTLQSLIGDFAVFTASSRPVLTSSKSPLRRNYSTSYERSQAGRSKFGSSEGRGRFDGRDSALEAKRSDTDHRVSPRVVQRKQWLDARGIRPPSNKQIREDKQDRDIQQHLKWLGDPVKLADFVRRSLRDNGNFDFIQELVRAASKHDLHTVSWNHLIGWQMSKGKMNASIATYNEVRSLNQSIY